MNTELFQARISPQPDAYWRSLHYFNLFRLTVAGFFVVVLVRFGALPPLGSTDPRLFFLGSIFYTLFAALMVIPIGMHRPRFNLLLSLQVSADIVFVVLLMYASDGIRSGLGLLLLASLAATGMVSRGRLALFYAALASIAILLLESYRLLTSAGDSSDFLLAAFTSMGYFATAWLAYVLTRRVIASERLAEEQSIDLANLAQVNRLVIQDMQDGVLVVDGKGMVRQRNAQAENMLGKPAMFRRELRLHDYAPQLAARLAQWQQDTSPVQEPLYFPISGKRLLPRFMPVGAQRSLGALIFLEDLSRLQAQAQQIKLAALGRLTANIAHEIRNPLSAVSHAAELLQEDMGEDPTRQRLLQIIRDNSQRLERMVAEVLQLNRRDRVQAEKIALNPALEIFAGQFVQTERLPDAALSVEAPSDLSIFFDRHHFDQVLWNLCRNAWQHGRKQPGSVRLQAVRTSVAAVQLDVIDDGPGVEQSLRAQLFEPFFTTVSTGTGLGLYIARELCEANGATLEYVEGGTGGQFRISCKGGEA